MFPYPNVNTIIRDFSDYMTGNVVCLSTETTHDMLYSPYNLGRVEAWYSCGYVKRLRNDSCIRFRLTDIGINAILLYRL